MWRFAIFVYSAVSLIAAQNSRTLAHQDHSGHGWDIRLAVPGEPGSDYPTLGAIPRTSFSCAGKIPGYYADLETNCQVFRVCTVGSTYGFQSFICPNGTLFNQAVFVCDWWMNVNCQESQQLLDNNEKFGNLRLGPQFMKDIKKMLMHPMHNPYDRSVMKSNLIVMQDYKSPFGELFPNGAIKAGSEKSPNNIYVPTRQIQPPGFDNNDISFAASTISPRYLPAAFTTFHKTMQRDAEVFQQQRQHNQHIQSNRQQSAQIRQQNTNFSNGHTGKFTQTNQYTNTLYSSPIQSNNIRNTQFGQKPVTRPMPATSTQNSLNIQRGQLKQKTSSNTSNNQNPSKVTNGKQAEYSISYNKREYNSNQEKQPHTYKESQFSNEPIGKYRNELKQNLVSGSDVVPSNVIAKTVTFKRIIQNPKHGAPKSRITVKTWIVKPNTSAKLVEPTPYTYDRPTQPPAQKLINTTPYSYVYNRPTTLAQKIISEVDRPYVYNKPTTQTQKIISETEGSYVYNRPKTQAQKIINKVDEPYAYKNPTTQAQKIINAADGPYFYNKPTTAAKLIVTTLKEPAHTFSTVATPHRTISPLYQSPTTVPLTQSFNLYLPPTTYNPSSRLYLPPLQHVTLSEQYLAPSDILQPTGLHSERLRASPTMPSPTSSLPDPALDLDNYSGRGKTDEKKLSNNLSFTDILTKQRLDNTVSNIVKDTSQILNTAPPVKFEQLRDINSIDYPNENYLPSRASTDSGEKLTSLTPTTAAKNAGIISSPSADLEPPIETSSSKQNSNQFSNLPFYKENLKPSNSIERTVSLKISIPEKIADLLFKSHNDSDFDKVEILNTESTNYLVLSNKQYLMNNNLVTNFIPIGKLISDKQSNISNSQALVFSLLADSINIAKKYNLAQQGTIQSTSSQTHFLNSNNEELDQISNKISQLTSSQFSENNQGNYKSANLVETTSTTNNNQGYQYREPAENQISQNEYQATRSSKNNLSYKPNNQEQIFARHQSNTNPNVDINSKQIYSGQLYQLPVPDVTSQIYNRQSTSNSQSNDIKPIQHSAENTSKVSSFEVKSHSTSHGPAARLELAPTSELDHFNSQENFSKFINSNNGISAQLQDKIVGIIPHPLENNKVVTYKKDESYYIYTKLDNNIAQNTQIQGNTIQSNAGAGQQSAKLIQGNNLPDFVAFQLIPSVSYQLKDEKEQQKILKPFQIDELGNPKEKANLMSINQSGLISNIDYSVDHTLTAKPNNGRLNEISNLYAGPSSYSAPQSTVGRLGSRQDFTSRLELEDSNGYVKISPSRPFTF